jgi:hypothetical protein
MTGDDQPTAGSDGQPIAESFGDEIAAGRPAQRSAGHLPRLKPHQIRRVPKPRMTGLLDSPIRNLSVGVAYTVTVMIVATVAYMAAGWSFRDAIYMVIVTIYTVGYNEVRPINTPALNVITIGLIVLGCTGVIFLTGALVQFFTLDQLNKTMGLKRMNRQIDELKGHVVVCGFGRLGHVLARSLSASSAGFVILEENEARATEARLQGYLCIHGDATNEQALLAAGVMRANALATVLSNDALNVFITLSARALNPHLSIIARGELSSTESKLLQAGADKVGAADPYRRRTYRRTDPARGIRPLHRWAGAHPRIPAGVAQFWYGTRSRHRRSAKPRGAHDRHRHRTTGQGGFFHHSDQSPRRRRVHRTAPCDDRR